MKMTFQEIRIIATGPCIANQLRDVNTICRRSWYIAAHIWKIFDFKTEVVPFIINFSTDLTTVVKLQTYRLIHGIFHISPCIIPRPTYQMTPEVSCAKNTATDYLQETLLIWIISMGMIIWLVYFRSLYICKIFHINAKYITIKVRKIYNGTFEHFL